MSRHALAAAILFLVPQLAVAQSHQPYAGQQTRQIKALSEQQLADLEAGRGMGLALAAELNGYPGPAHVLELAEPLGLTPAQRTRMSELFEAMKGEAVPLGRQLIAAEAGLDRQFADKTITGPKLADDLRAIGALQAALRTTHLKYHLATVEVLTPEQIVRYGELRGYASEESQPHRHR
jgi:Spy/CpxP family protein refolding chaperone